ncbi:MAG: Nif3-like dinuclear metal center hexameric protein [Spirochaetales bacterium]|nr:Nif3-like dinuclear metal center hexameric protein [Spirochaetales bacterium]
MKIEEITSYLDSLLEITGEKHNNEGLTIRGRKNVSKIGVSVNLSFSVIEKAINEHIDFLLTHHANWESTDAEYVKSKRTRLLQYNISHYFAHDALDMHGEYSTALGFNNLFGWKIHKHFNNTAGIIAASEYLDIDDLSGVLSKKLKSKLEIFKNNDKVDNIGIIPGWGARPEWIKEAKGIGINTFISGEAIHFGKLYAYESNINLILAGHYATEKPIMEFFTGKISEDTGMETVYIEDHDSAALF